jgi:hypothetical protein
VIYLIGWTGRGWIIFVGLIFAVLGGFGLSALTGKDELICFGGALILLGVISSGLGFMWNRPATLHKFGPVPMQYWD